MTIDVPYHYLPADGWYMTHPNPAGATFPRTFYRVALWRVDPDGTIVGLISPRRGAADAADVTRLLTPPRGEGAHYVHADDLTDEDREQIRARRFS